MSSRALPACSLDDRRETRVGQAEGWLIQMNEDPAASCSVSIRKVDIRLPGKWEFKLSWRKAILLKSSRWLSEFGPVGCQSRTLSSMSRYPAASRKGLSDVSPALKMGRDCMFQSPWFVLEVVGLWKIVVQVGGRGMMICSNFEGRWLLRGDALVRDVLPHPSIVFSR